MAEAKRILIVGGSGFVGLSLAQNLAKHHKVFITHGIAHTSIPGIQSLPFHQITEKDQTKTLMQIAAPDVVIYTVGSNDIAYAEKNSRLVQHQHTAGATHLQAASEFLKAKFIYLSSDTVFSGHGGNYSEDATAIPATNLGKAKIAAENHVRSRSLNHMIIRSAPLLGRGPIDHPSWVDRLREYELLKKKISVSDRLIRNPIHISALFEMVNKIIDLDLRNQTFHLGGITKISEAALAQRICKTLGISSQNLDISESKGEGDPHDYSLNFTRTQNLLKLPILTLEESLQRLTTFTQ